MCRRYFIPLYKKRERSLDAKGNKKKYKAIYFDLIIKELRIHFSQNNPKGAYSVIKRFLLSRDFSHIQYSGYHTNFKTTDLHIFDIMREMKSKFKWFPLCVNKIEVTNVGLNYDLLPVVKSNRFEPE